MKSRRMAYLALSVVLTIISVAIPAMAKSDEKPVMKFKETTHDFGMVKEEGGPVTCEFPFTNDGKGNLVVLHAKAECGCTTPEFPKSPVAPGKSGIIKVTYNPLGRPGAFDKVVTLKCNGSPSKIRLKIKGTVVPKNN